MAYPEPPSANSAVPLALVGPLRTNSMAQHFEAKHAGMPMCTLASNPHTSGQSTLTTY